MSAIENLIRIKKQCKNDDIVRLLDEVVNYEKLSRSKLFQDLQTSEIAQKKLPLLASTYQGDLYALSLATLAGNIILHLEERIPAVLQKPMEELSQRDQKRMELMNKSLIPVSYRSLLEYDEERFSDQVVAVYDAKRSGNLVALLIIVRDQDTYQIYQGYYQPGDGIEDVQKQHQKLKPYLFQKENVTFSFLTYSLLGNNFYPFGDVSLSDGRTYTVSMNYKDLYLDGGTEMIQIPLQMEQRNTLNLCKTDPNLLGKTLCNWIFLYFHRILIQEETLTLVVFSYELCYGHGVAINIGELYDAGHKTQLMFRPYHGESGVLENYDPEIKESNWIYLPGTDAERLRSLREEPEAFGRIVLELIKKNQQGKKEKEEEHATTEGGAQRGDSGNSENTGK